jgi:archaeosine-15-forming tRNA-guanine transglycosylase
VVAAINTERAFGEWIVTGRCRSRFAFNEARRLLAGERTVFLVTSNCQLWAEGRANVEAAQLAEMGREHAVAVHESGR